jgi:MFS family permease
MAIPPPAPDILAESGFQPSAVFRALKHRNYRLFFGGQFVSLIGTWMQSTAQSWLVYRLTGSPAMLGAVSFASLFPVFLLSPIGGAAADRYDRRRVVIAAQTAMMLLAFALAALTLSGHVRVWQVVVMAALAGVANAFDIPARQSFLVAMVGKTDLMNAIALNSSMFNSARIAGPAVAGALVAAAGEGWCFFLNGLSFLAVLFSLARMSIAPAAAEPAGASPAAEILEGFGYVRRTEPILALLVLLGLSSVAGMPYSVLLPVFADRILGGGPQALGFLTGATGLGALAGALSLAARRGVKGLGRYVVLASSAFGCALILFSLSRAFWLSVALLVPVGFSVMVQMAASNTLIQTMVPDRLRGRVMSMYSMVFLGMAPFGGFLAGAAAERLGAPVTVAIGGCVCLFGSAVFWTRWRTLRIEARQLIVAQQAAAGDPVERSVESAGT